MTNCFCCHCDEMYAFDETKPNYGRICSCSCECGCADLDEFHEIHDEITEACCLLCDESFETSRSTWREERGKYNAFCSDECEMKYKGEGECALCSAELQYSTYPHCLIKNGRVLVVCIDCKQKDENAE